MKTAISKNPILIIDREGLIGKPLSLKLSREFPVVFVSRETVVSEDKSKNIIYVPFCQKIPAIPGNKYSQIVFIDGEGSDKELLPKLIQQARGINSDFIYAQGLSEEKKYVTKEALGSYPGARVVLFGDIFDDKLILGNGNFKSTVNRFIYQAQRFGRIQVAGEGLRSAHVAHISDVVAGLVDVAFGMHQSQSLFYIFPKHSPTELSLAHMIQKANPEITIDFVRHDPRVGRISYPLGGLNLLDEKYPLAKKIRKIDIKQKIKQEECVLHKNTKKISKSYFSIILIAMFLLLAPFMFAQLFYSLGLKTFYYSKNEIDRGNIASSGSALRLSKTFFGVGKQALKLLSLQARGIGMQNSIDKLSEEMVSGYKISEGLSQAFDSGAYFSKVLTGKSKNPIDDFAKGRNYLKNSLISLQSAKAEEKIPAPISQTLEGVDSLIRLLSVVSDIMPNILGMEDPKTYLILFQDNAELRPGGGRIGSYGILKLNKGKITEFSTGSVSEADDRLRGHVEPPFALRRYLSKEHWYLRDSNFDVDFTKIAQTASNFLFAETGQKIDGVIAIDALLKEKLSDVKTSYLALAQAISDALLQKHLLLTFDDFKNIFTVNGWSSSLWDERKESSESINDFVGVSEANFGLNRINNFIKRQQSQTVKIESDGSLLGEINLSYKNNDIDSLQGGNYKNYLRVILPENAFLTTVSVNDVSQVLIDAIIDPKIYEAKNFKAPNGLEIEKTTEDKKTIYGFLTNIPAGKSVKVKIQYMVLRKNVFNLDNFSYNIKIFKQPGVDSIPYSFSLYYPENLRVADAGGLKQGDGLLSYSEKIAFDKNLIISFVKK